MSEVDHGGHESPKRHTVAELLDRWLEHIETQGRAPSTIVRNRSVTKVNIVPRLGSARIDRLGPTELDHFYSSLARSGLKPLTGRKSHAVLSAALHQALRWGWIDRNPTERASPPPVRQKEVVPPTLEEVGRLLEACEEHNPDLGSLVYAA